MFYVWWITHSHRCKKKITLSNGFYINRTLITVQYTLAHLIRIIKPLMTLCFTTATFIYILFQYNKWPCYMLHPLYRNNIWITPAQNDLLTCRNWANAIKFHLQMLCFGCVPVLFFEMTSIVNIKTSAILMRITENENEYGTRRTKFIFQRCLYISNWKQFGSACINFYFGTNFDFSSFKTFGEKTKFSSHVSFRMALHWFDSVKAAKQYWQCVDKTESDNIYNIFHIKFKINVLFSKKMSLFHLFSMWCTDNKKSTAKRLKIRSVGKWEERSQNETKVFMWANWNGQK